MCRPAAPRAGHETPRRLRSATLAAVAELDQSRQKPAGKVNSFALSSHLVCSQLKPSAFGCGAGWTTLVAGAAVTGSAGPHRERSSALIGIIVFVSRAEVVFGRPVESNAKKQINLTYLARRVLTLARPADGCGRGAIALAAPSAQARHSRKCAAAAAAELSSGGERTRCPVHTNAKRT